MLQQNQLHPLPTSGELPSEPEISDTVAAEVNETSPSTASDKSDDGLVHDGKITVTLGGDAYKGNPSMQLLWTVRK